MVLVRRAADITPVFSGLTLQVVGKQSLVGYLVGTNKTVGTKFNF